jgi:hypothetical protein
MLRRRVVLLGSTMQFEEVGDSVPGMVVVASSSDGGVQSASLEVELGRDVDAGENRAPTPVTAGDGASMRRYLVEGIATAYCVYSLVWVSWIGRWRRFRHRFTSWGHCIWSRCLMVVASGGVVCISHVDVGETRRRGVVGPW